MHLLPVLVLAFPGTRLDSTLVLCLCAQAADLVPPSHFALPRGTSGLRLAVKIVPVSTIWVAGGPPEVLHKT